MKRLLFILTFLIGFNYCIYSCHLNPTYVGNSPVLVVENCNGTVDVSTTVTFFNDPANAYPCSDPIPTTVTGDGNTTDNSSIILVQTGAGNLDIVVSKTINNLCPGEAWSVTIDLAPYGGPAAINANGVYGVATGNTTTADASFSATPATSASLTAIDPGEVVNISGIAQPTDPNTCYGFNDSWLPGSGTWGGLNSQAGSDADADTPTNWTAPCDGGATAISHNVTMPPDASAAAGCLDDLAIDIVVRTVVVSVGPFGPYCETDDPYTSLAATLTVTPSDFEGTYTETITGAGVTDHGDGTFDFDPVAAGDGNHLITYTVSINGCDFEDTTHILVDPQAETPTPVYEYHVCQGANIPAGEGMTAHCQNCPGAPGTPAIPAQNTTPGTTGTVTVNCTSCPTGITGGGNYPGTPDVTATFATPVFPPGAFVTSLSATVTLTHFPGDGDDIAVFIDGNSIIDEGCGWPFTTATVTATGNFNYTVNNDACGTPISSSYAAPPVVGAADCIDDVAGADSQMDSGSITYTYQLPPTGTCVPAVPGTAAGTSTPNVPTWWDAASNGNQVGTGNVLDPTGLLDANGTLVDLNVPGTYVFYTQCDCKNCPSDRTMVTLVVEPEQVAGSPVADDTNILCCGDAITFTNPSANIHPFVGETGANGSGITDYQLYYTVNQGSAGATSPSVLTSQADIDGAYEVYGPYNMGDPVDIITSACSACPALPTDPHAPAFANGAFTGMNGSAMPAGVYHITPVVTVKSERVFGLIPLTSTSPDATGFGPFQAYQHSYTAEGSLNNNPVDATALTITVDIYGFENPPATCTITDLFVDYFLNGAYMGSIGPFPAGAGSVTLSLADFGTVTSNDDIMVQLAIAATSGAGCPATGTEIDNGAYAIDHSVSFDILYEPTSPDVGEGRLCTDYGNNHDFVVLDPICATYDVDCSVANANSDDNEISEYTITVTVSGGLNALDGQNYLDNGGASVTIDGGYWVDAPGAVDIDGNGNTTPTDINVASGGTFTITYPITVTSPTVTISNYDYNTTSEMVSHGGDACELVMNVAYDIAESDIQTPYEICYNGSVPAGAGLTANCPSCPVLQGGGAANVTWWNDDDVSNASAMQGMGSPFNPLGMIGDIDANGDGDFIDAGENNVTISATTPGHYVLYVQCECDNECPSQRIPVSFYVRPQVLAPSLTGVNPFCSADAAYPVVDPSQPAAATGAATPWLIPGVNALDDQYIFYSVYPTALNAAMGNPTQGVTGDMDETRLTVAQILQGEATIPGIDDLVGVPNYCISDTAGIPIEIITPITGTETKACTDAGDYTYTITINPSNGGAGTDAIEDVAGGNVNTDATAPDMTGAQYQLTDNTGNAVSVTPTTGTDPTVFTIIMPIGEPYDFTFTNITPTVNTGCDLQITGDQISCCPSATVDGLPQYMCDGEFPNLTVATNMSAGITDDNGQLIQDDTNNGSDIMDGVSWWITADNTGGAVPRPYTNADMIPLDNCTKGMYTLTAYLRCGKDNTENTFDPEDATDPTVGPTDPIYQDSWILAGSIDVEIFPILTFTLSHPNAPLECDVRITPSCPDLALVTINWSANSLSAPDVSGDENDLSPVGTTAYDWSADAVYAFGPGASLGNVTFYLGWSDPNANNPADHLPDQDSITCKSVTNTLDYTCCTAEAGLLVVPDIETCIGTPFGVFTTDPTSFDASSDNIPNSDYTMAYVIVNQVTGIIVDLVDGLSVPSPITGMGGSLAVGTYDLYEIVYRNQLSVPTAGIFGGLNVGDNFFAIQDNIPLTAPWQTPAGVACMDWSGPIEIIVNPLPEPFITGDNQICLGDATNLTAFGSDIGPAPGTPQDVPSAANYDWEQIAGPTEPATVSYSPSTTTIYTVTVTSSEGCVATAQYEVFVQNYIPTSDHVAYYCEDVNSSDATQFQSDITTVTGGNWTDAMGNAVTNPTMVDPHGTNTDPLAPYSYTYTVSTSFGCISSGTLTYNFYELPQANISGVNNLCPGELGTFNISNTSNVDLTATLSNGDNIFVPANSTVTSAPYSAGEVSILLLQSLNCDNTGTGLGLNYNISCDVVADIGGVQSVVWYDADSNGVYDPINELPIGGVTVVLYSNVGPDGIPGNADDNDPVVITVTNTAGIWGFNNLPIYDSAGNLIQYYVQFPSNVNAFGGSGGLTISNAGGITLGDLNDSDPNSAGVTSTFNLGSGSLPNIGAGYFIDITPILSTSILNSYTNANCEQSDVIWTVSSDNNINNYIIERSKDGVSWFAVGNVTPIGTTSVHEYSYTDEDNLPGLVYYRIKCIETNGNTTTSSVIASNNSCDDQMILTNVYPNPVAGTLWLNCEINSLVNESIVIEVIDLLGRVHGSYKVNVVAGVNRIEINTESLSQAMYFVGIKDGNSTSKYMKFTKID